MPQLDKYIFFHQITSLTIVFFFIYIYTRKTILPNISSILKFRNKLIRKLTKQNEILNQTQRESEVYFSSKAVKFVLNVSQKINSIFNYYENKALSQYSNLYNNITNNIKSNESTYSFILKTRKEKKRNIIS